MARGNRVAAGLVVLVGMAGLAGCSGTGGAVDGRMVEWASDSAVRADGHFVMMRFRVPGPKAALQASERTVALYLDADASAKTGRVNSKWKTPLNTIGVDAEIVFSPRGADGKPGHGVEFRALGPDGVTKKVSGAVSGLVFSPTYASDWYEMRVDRRLLAATGLGDATARGGKIVGMWVTLDEQGKVDGYADPFEAVLPPAAEEPRLATVDAPMKPAGAVRVLSYNVEKSRPVKSPEAFARVLTLLDPDVVLVQEWDEGDAAAMEAWFSQHAPGLGKGWKVRKAEGTGTAVASRLPLAALAPDTLWMSDGSEKPRQVRAAAATVLTPGGPLALTSVHLKCCGGATGREEGLRQSEARAIRGMEAGFEPAARMIMGDFNLVGTRAPLELMGTGLDGGLDLAVAEPVVLGDDVQTTWRDWGAGFSPGRLDYALFSASKVRVVQSFVLDTSVLSDESLARMGLDRTDGSASDHMPVVVDVVVGK